jgi:hypothetical protein
VGRDVAEDVVAEAVLREECGVGVLLVEREG